ncbi:hypothetical protein Taro_021470 [Colocasia esculenta]|uniref:Uncharacterized protein n=1 Tax=Colocasia esculenta TaxID=4460 RepID=A0A843URG7_COLES|nr:hypothetical protein [Colocasia esculenta]
MFSGSFSITLGESDSSTKINPIIVNHIRMRCCQRLKCCPANFAGIMDMSTFGLRVTDDDAILNDIFYKTVVKTVGIIHFTWRQNIHNPYSASIATQYKFA